MIEQEKRATIGAEHGRAIAFLIAWSAVLLIADGASAQALDLNFMTVMTTTGEAVVDHPFWSSMLAMFAVIGFVMFGFTSNVKYLLGGISPILMAGVVINWRSIMGAFISGLKL